MSFRKQLIIGQSAALLVVVITAVTAIVALQATTNGINRLTRRFADNLELSHGLRLEAEQLVATSRGLLLTGHAQYQRRFDALDKDLENLLRRLQQRAALADNAQVFAVQRDAAAYVAAVQRAAHERSENGDLRQIVEVFDDDLSPRRTTFERSVTAFVHEEQRRLDSSLAHAQDLAHRAQITLACTAAISIAIGLVLACVVHRRLRNQFERVQAANVAANRAAAARKELLAIVSHDLRNPLNAIMLGANLLQDTERERRVATTISNAAERMQHLIDELIDVARIETGSIQLRPTTFDAGAALELAIGMFADAAQQRSIHLHASSAVATVHGDRERILQVLSNLIANALRFVPPGGKIAVGASQLGDRVRFCVCDTGPGIADEDAARVFERHWQGAARDAGSGLGLGLFICKGLVEAHGGRIGLESRLGEGTTFWFELRGNSFPNEMTETAAHRTAKSTPRS